MSDRDLSNMETAADEPLSFDEGVSGLESILDGPAKEPEKSNIQNPDEEDDDDVVETAEDSDDDLEPEVDDEDDEESDDEDDDDAEESDALALDDETVIELGNGVKASLADLKADYGQVQKRVADFQRDYTQKTAALSDDRREIETQSQRVLQWANELANQRNFVATIQKQVMPQQPSPDMMDEDPIGYMRAKANYESTMQQMQQLEQYSHQEQRQRQQQTAAQRQHILEQEKKLMLDKMPELAKPDKYAAFQKDIVETFMPSYGFSPEEISTISDHRFAEVIRDAVNYRKLKASQPKTREKLQGKPPVLRSGKSLSAKGKTAMSKKATADRLRKTGSLEAGINALMDFDL